MKVQSLILVLTLFCSWGCRSSSFKKEEVFRFAVISDLNRGYGSVSYLEHLTRSIDYIVRSESRMEPIHLVLSTGDMVAGQKVGLDYKKMWNSFHKHVTIPLNQSQIPFAPSPGNHDASSSPQFALERSEYQDAFLNRIPTAHLYQFEMLEGSQYPLYYAFIFKNVLFVALDATNVETLSEVQFNWLAQVLLQNPPVKYKVVFGHVPLYPFAYDRAHEYMGAKDIQSVLKLEKLLETHRVDYFLSGHHHAYYDGHRRGHVEYVSVPLLGDGPRVLLGTKEVSPYAFLVFEVSGKGISMKVLSGLNLQPLNNDKLPETIRVPDKSSVSCTECANFPSEAFLGNTDRVLYFKKP